jgi:hypothetical protein
MQADNRLELRHLKARASKQLRINAVYEATRVIAN